MVFFIFFFCQFWWRWRRHGRTHIVVLKIQKPDPKGKGEFDNLIIREGVTHGSNDGIKEGNGLQKRAVDSEIKAHSGKRVVDKVTTTGKARSHTFIRALPTSRNVPFKDVINLEVAGAKFASAISNCFFKDDRFLCFEMDSIAASGYTTFQQRDFSLLYFHFFKQHFQSESTGRPTKILWRLYANCSHKHQHTLDCFTLKV